MLNSVSISNKINKFNYTIDNIGADKSLSIRFILIASMALGKSKGFNILNSEDVNNTITSLKKLGIKIKKKRNYCEILGKGLNSFSYKNNTHFSNDDSSKYFKIISEPFYLLRKYSTICSGKDF